MKFRLEHENKIRDVWEPDFVECESSPLKAAVRYVESHADATDPEDDMRDLHYILVTPADDEARALTIWRTDEKGAPFLRFEVYPVIEWDGVERKDPLPAN